MKERTIPCVYYTNCGADCQKGKHNVSHAHTCQHCTKYMPRKTGNAKKETKGARLSKIREKEYRQEKREYQALQKRT